tara:strand:+ start:3081 stop:3800 length:720 start_codon:yes stop_codon:yes gene_type:complete
MGTNFHGWQIQPNAITVQQKIQEGLSILLKEKVQIYGAGRTDTGVHAKQMYAHFDSKVEIILDELCHRLNSFVPDSILIKSIFEVHSNAHARYDAKFRRYEYWICSYKNPFLNKRAWLLFNKLDYDLMNKAAEYLLEVIDFTSFSKLHTEVNNNKCNIKKAFWEKKEDKWVFTIESNRFLRNMVRAIVGTLVNVGKGNISLKEFKEIVAKKDRSLAGMSAPAQGLYLVYIEYPSELVND